MNLRELSRDAIVRLCSFSYYTHSPDDISRIPAFMAAVLEVTCASTAWTDACKSGQEAKRRLKALVAVKPTSELTVSTAMDGPGDSVCLTTAEERPELSVLLTVLNHLRLPKGSSVDNACLVKIRSQVDIVASTSAAQPGAYKLTLLRIALLAVKLIYMVPAEDHSGLFETVACNCLREVADRFQACSYWSPEGPLQPNELLLCSFIVQMLLSLIQKCLQSISCSQNAAHPACTLLTALMAGRQDVSTAIADQILEIGEFHFVLKATEHTKHVLNLLLDRLTFTLSSWFLSKHSTCNLCCRGATFQSYGFHITYKAACIFSRWCCASNVSLQTESKPVVLSSCTCFDISPQALRAPRYQPAGSGKGTQHSPPGLCAAPCRCQC